MEFTHAKIGLLEVKELTQRDVEAFGKSYRELDRASMTEQNGAVVRAAVKAGIILSPHLSVEDVDNLKPYVVNWYALNINAAYEEATTIPNG